MVGREKLLMTVVEKEDLVERVLRSRKVDRRM